METTLLDSDHVGHIVESGELPVGGSLINEQPVSVSVRETSWSLLSSPTSRRAPPSVRRRSCTDSPESILDLDGLRSC